MALGACSIEQAFVQRGCSRQSHAKCLEALLNRDRPKKTPPKRGDRELLDQSFPAPDQVDRAQDVALSLARVRISPKE